MLEKIEDKCTNKSFEIRDIEEVLFSLFQPLDNRDILELQALLKGIIESQGNLVMHLNSMKNLFG